MRVINAEGLVLGRLASHLAKELLNGEEIVVVNSEKAIITGNKADILNDYNAMRHRGQQRKAPKVHRGPDKILKRTVRGMMPYQQPRGRTAYKRLKTYIGVPKEFEKAELETVETAHRPGVMKYMELGDLSRRLGAKF